MDVATIWEGLSGLLSEDAVTYGGVFAEEEDEQDSGMVNDDDDVKRRVWEGS